MLSAASRRKSRCDATFYSDILVLNEGRPICRAFALIYSKAVSWFGESAFAGMDGRLGGGLSESDIEQSKAAIASALTSLSESELQRLSDDVAAGRSGIDWSRPVYFDRATRKLVNR